MGKSWEKQVNAPKCGARFESCTQSQHGEGMGVAGPSEESTGSPRKVMDP